MKFPPGYWHWPVNCLFTNGSLFSDGDDVVFVLFLPVILGKISSKVLTVVYD